MSMHSRVDSNTFTMGNPMPESTLTLCQSRLYPPVGDFLDLALVSSRVPDPWHFGEDPDPDARIHASDYWIRIRILLFCHWSSRGQQKTNFYIKFFCLLRFVGTVRSFSKHKKDKRSHKTVGNKVFPTTFAWWQKDPYVWIRIHTSV
jgi:hypothetical protein